MSLLTELKRRNLIRVASVYAVASWIIMQVIDVMAPALNMPDWVDGFFAIALLVGFPIAMIVAWAFEMTPDGIKRTDAAPDGAHIVTQASSKLDYLLLVSLVLVGSLLIWQQFRPEIERGSAEIPPTGGAGTSTQADADLTTDSISAADPASESPQTTAVSDASIAVLPFDDMSPEGDQQYFADGISEELLNVLASVKSLKVAGRTSSFSFKERNKDLREIGRLLGVANILEGSVRKQGNRVRITATLIKVDDGFNLWTETYDRELDDVFAVQDEIAAEILTAFTALLAGATTKAPQQVARTNVDAYGLYLKAKQLVYNRSLGSLQEAKELLDRALLIAPNYAPTYAIRSITESLLSDAPGSYGRTPAAVAHPIAAQLADKALTLDAELADAHAARGLVYLHENSMERATLALQRAIELNPNHIDARNWLSLTLGATGRFRDVAEANLALFELDPLYRPGATNAVNQLLLIGDKERAQAVLWRLKEHDEQSLYNWSFSAFLAEEGRIAEALTLGMSVFKDYSDTNRGGVLVSRHLNIGNLAGARKFNIPRFEIYALLIEGRFDSAVVAARRMLEASPSSYSAQSDYVTTLGIAGRHVELVDYYRTSYGNAAAFDKQLYEIHSAMLPPFAELAAALQATGDANEFDAVMSRWRNSINIGRAGGANNAHWDLEDAQWFALQGETAKAINWLSKSASHSDGLLGIKEFGLTNLAALLEGNPKLAELQAVSRKRIDEERRQLGLGSIAGT